VYPHMLRHTFATEYLEQGGNIRHLQMLLGHSSLATTEIYLHVVDSELENHLKTIQERW